MLASYDNELTYQKLTDICRLLTERPELDYAATNPTMFVRLNSATCRIAVPSAMIGHAVHRMPTYIGKPGTRMVEMALDMTGRTRDEAVLVGDRLYTDIACANMADISAALCAFRRIYTRRNAELAVSCGVCLSIREGNVCGLGVWTKKRNALKIRNGYGFGTKKKRRI